jgi:hypothetical protein
MQPWSTEITVISDAPGAAASGQISTALTCGGSAVCGGRWMAGPLKRAYSNELLGTGKQGPAARFFYVGLNYRGDVGRNRSIGEFFA